MTVTEPAPVPTDEGGKPRTDQTVAQRWPKALTVTALTAALALISGAIGLVFDLWPQLRPDPRTQRSSTERIVAVDRYVSRLDYLHRRYPDPKAFRSARAHELALAAGQTAGLRIEGELVYVEVALHGFKGSRVTLERSVYDNANRERTIPAQRESLWTGDAPSDQWIAEMWLAPVIGPKRKFFVRAEIRDDRGVLLAMADSAPFRGLDPDKIVP